MDSTRLDVFAMEPVTLRWVQAELTIAMDLFTRCILGLRVTPGVDQERRRRLGAVRGAQPARGPGGLAAGGGLALSRGARDAGRGRGHGAGAAVFRARPAARHSSWSTTAASTCPIMSPARAPGWGSRSSRPVLTRRPTNRRSSASSGRSVRGCLRRCRAIRARTCSAGGRTARATRSSTSASWSRSSGSGLPSSTTGVPMTRWPTRGCPG